MCLSSHKKQTMVLDPSQIERDLTSGVEHTVSGTLMVRSNGEFLKDASGTPVTAFAKFTPEKAVRT